MSNAIDLGTISASVALDLSKLASGRAQFSAELSGIGGALDRLATQAEADGRRIAAAAFSREEQAALRKQEAALKAQAAQAQALRVAAVNSFTGIAAGVTLAGIAAVKMSADFESSMTKISNNTTMTAADIVKMKQTVIALGKESGASFDDLGQGFMHIVNFGFKASEATTILREAMKSAVATGSSTADTADILAKSLHEFGLKATDAGHAMNVMHLAAAQGNMTLEQFDQAAGPAFAQAANLGVGLTDVSAAMSALTRHGLDASEAATQVKDILVHMINPSKSAREELEKLSEKTGINLVQDFSQAGLKAKGLTGVLDDLARATNGNGQEIYKLIQAQRGGLGAMILAGTGAKDYRDILASLTDAMTGKVDPATQGYEKSLHTLNNEIARVANEIRADFIPVGEKLTPVFEAAIPVIHGTAEVLGEALDVFGRLPQPIQETILAVGGLKLGSIALNMALGTMGGKLPSLVGGLGKLTGAFGATTTAEAAVATEGATAFAAGGAWALGIGAAIALVWSLKGAWDHVSGAQAQALHDKAWGEIAQGKAAVPLGLGAQQVANRTEASRILGSQEYKNAATSASSAKAAIVSLRAGGVQAFQQPGQAAGTALNEYNAALKTQKQNLAEATAALAHYQKDAHALRADADRMGGGNAVTEAMAKHIGQATGVECGAAVTKALQAAGFKETATALAKAAVANPSRQMKPDGLGEFPPGTVLFFPGKKGAKNIGSDPTEHFGIASALNDKGQQTVLESTTAGSGGRYYRNSRHYRGDRTFGQIAAEHGGQYYAFAPDGDSGKSLKGSKAGGYTAPVDPDAVKERSAFLLDQKDQLYEAGHGTFDNRRHEALRDKDKANSDPSATAESRAVAQQVYFAKIKEINADERKEQRSHYDALLRQWKEHLRQKAEAQKQALAAQQAIVRDAARRKGNLSDLSFDMTDSTAALTQDPETYQFGKDRAEAARRLRDRQEAIGKNQTLGPYGKTDIDPGVLMQQAQAEYDAAMKHIQAEEDAKAAREKAEADDKAQREKDKASRVIEEADRAAEKQRLDVEETARFEYEQGMITLAQYQAFLKAKLAATQEWADANHTILTKDWMAAKAALDETAGNPGKEKTGKDPLGWLGDEAIDGGGKALLGVLEGGKGKLHGMRAETKAWEKETLDAIKKVAVAWAMSQLFGAKHGDGFNFGNNALGGMNLLGGKPKSAATNTASLLPSLTTGALPKIAGINGPISGLGKSAGGAMDIAGLLASFLPGGGLLGGLLGGKGGGLFGSLGKLFHFAEGGLVPGHGFGDTVPAMLTPGERVLTKAQQQGMGGSPVINIAHHGDVYGAEGVDQMHAAWAWGVSQDLTTATAGT